jgi:hypothetical protein
MVTVFVPVVAELLAVRVKTLVVVALVGLKDAVTPLGRPEATKLTLLAKPFVGVTVIVLVPLLPWTTLKALGAADSVKFGGAVTVRAIVVVCVKLPDLPVMVTVVVAAAAPAEAVSVNVEVAVLFAGGVTGLVENTAVTPLGRPEALSVVAELKLFWLLIVIVLVPPARVGVMVRLLGAADTVKFGAGVTVRAMVVV